MCGIAGVLGQGAGRLPDDAIERALEQMRHRGPDETTVWSRPDVRLAHARLAIIDRQHGKQPMVTADGRFVVVFNGEIYNHRDLRRELLNSGWPLSTDCDTEVLPYLYAQHGPGMVERLRGMFAFVIVDLERREAFMARDPFGKKPLYFRAGGGDLAFASTLDALAPLVEGPMHIDPQSIADYLVLQYVPADRSPFLGVRKLLPGTSMLWRGGEPHFSRYWSPPVGDPAAMFDLERAKEDLRGQIRCAVAARLESEVPMGVFLSGGLDSSVVVAEMAELGVPVETYSIGFEQPDLDESTYAATVAHRFGTDHTMLRLEAEASTLLEDFAGAYDEPFADSSALATLAVARAAKDHVTVVLTGDGGDELFGGYERYRAQAVGQRLHDLLGPAATPAAAMLQVAGGLTNNHRLRAGAGFVAHPWSSYRDRMFHFSPDEVSRLMRRDLLADVDVAQASDRLNSLWSEATDRWVPWVDAQTYLPDDLLTKMDRATMASSVEARAPLLDQDLWSWVASVPRDQLVDRRSGKNLLREAYRGVLPDAILDRPKKGFGVPLAGWLRTHLRPMLNERVAQPGAALSCLIEPAAAAKVVERFLAGDDRWTYRAWNLLALATWLEHRRSLL